MKSHRYATAGLFVTGLLIAVPTAARAQESWRYGADYRTFEQQAYDNGYREGIAQGEMDARARVAFSFARNRDYRDADAGYRGGGDLSDYRPMFRRGFEAGYTEGYDRRARESGLATPRAGEPYPAPSTALLNPAAQIGFQDGYDVGRNDSRDRETYDPVRADRYREADHKYDRRYGTREEFKHAYRLGFEQGYEQGYRVGRR
jgi:hypothetical protein